LNIKKYIFLFLKDKAIKIPSAKFWAITLIVVAMGIKIEMPDGHILTVKDCFNEMEDCLSGDCFKIRKLK
jgi:hypothetical protein